VLLLSQIEYLYVFASHGLTLTEIKRLDLPENSKPEDLYHWLCYDAENQAVERFDFVSMESDDETEYREFKQGSLAFDESVGEFTKGSGEILALDRISIKTVTRAIKDQFLEFMGKLDSQ